MEDRDLGIVFFDGAFTAGQTHGTKEIIRRHNKSFNRFLTDVETMRQAGISRKSFYKYKKEIREESV